MSNMKRKIAIAVAPAARHKDEKSEHRGTKEECLSVMTPEEIAGDVIECYKNGAAIVHMHVRDENGHLTNDITQFKRTISLIKDKCDILIEGSTGGVSELSVEERGFVISLPEVEISAINMGSVNLGEAAFVNEPEDIRIWAKMMQDYNVVPVVQCFEPGMLETVRVLKEEGVLKLPIIYGIPMGFVGSQPSCSVNMQYMVNLMPDNAVWYFQQHGMRDLSMLAAAVAAGAKIIRVGFEDSIFYAPGKTAKTNAELVEKIAEVVRLIGYEVATADEVREFIGLNNINKYARKQ